MNPSDLPQKTYSPFCPLITVFLVFLFVQCAHLVDDVRQRSQINAVRAQMKTGLAQAQTVNQTTESVGRDLVALSSNSAEAAKIISEFKIRVNPITTRPNPK